MKWSLETSRTNKSDESTSTVITFTRYLLPTYAVMIQEPGKRRSKYYFRQKCMKSQTDGRYRSFCARITEQEHGSKFVILLSTIVIGRRSRYEAVEVGRKVKIDERMGAKPSKPI